MIFARSFVLPALLAALAGLASAPSAHAQTLLKEWRFATGSRASLEAHGWAGWGAFREKPATTYTATRLGQDSERSRLGVHAIAGASGDMGVMFAHTGSTLEAGARDDRFVVVTTFAPLSAPAGQLGYLVWSQASTNPASQVRILVHVDGEWYASMEQFKVARSSGAGGMVNAETKSFDLVGPAGLGTAQWSEVTFGEGQPISRRAIPVTKPIGTTLTGLGFLIMVGDAANRAVFLDDVAILGAAPAPPTPAAP